jgi:hypothetical protein
MNLNDKHIGYDIEMDQDMKMDFDNGKCTIKSTWTMA